MGRASSFARAAALLAALFGPVACPVLSSDDFTEVNAPATGGARAVLDGSADATLASGGSSVGAGGRGTGGDPPSASTGGAAPVDARVDGDGRVDPCAGCSVEECCAGVCVDLRRDPRNCGQCGVGCPGTTCSSACTGTCALGFVDCNRNVVDGCEVDAASDVLHCGNCDTACGFREDCVRGHCVCPDQTTDCDGKADNGCETDTSASPTNCGACGNVCGANELCVGGKCACAATFADCDADPKNGCEASLAASATCGSCGLDCGPQGACVAAGVCDCKAGFLNCDGVVPGCETPTTEAAHCGACDRACGASAPVCNGTACSAGCGALTACGSSCVDTVTDARNCGGCGKLVGLNQACVAGKPTCVPGFASCDANPLDCEVDLRSNAAHCGACATVCKPGSVCGNGVCECAPKTPNDCGTACEACCSSAQCSDGDSCTTDTCTAHVCGFSTECQGGGHCCAGQGCFECCGDGDCGGGRVCSGNQCVSPTCDPRLLLCGSRCVDPSTDPENCNGCGSACGAGRTCVAAVCTPSWVTIADPGALVAREKAAYAAFGSRMFVWGGADGAGKDLATGAAYDVATDTWSTVATTAFTPSPRVLATAVWTGTYMVVWGGGTASGTEDRADGGRYDPATNTWLSLSTSKGPTPRRAAYGAWTGSRVLFFGGVDRSGKPVDGVWTYDPSADSWSTPKTRDQPPALLDPTVGFSGSLLVVYGGRPGGMGASQDAFTFEPVGGNWKKAANAGDSRYGGVGTWDGEALLVWSGASLTADGIRYSPDTNSWASVGTSGAPSARYAVQRVTGWSTRVAGASTLLLGGYGGALGGPGRVPLTDGALYNTTTNSWTKLPAWPSGRAHLGGAAALAGTEFVIWGGRDSLSGALANVGERLRP